MSATSGLLDHLVIGGGPAGSMVAMRLAATGRRVTLIEKERAAHHKVCGEFLSHEAVEYLRQAGISPRDLGAASIRFVRLSAANNTAETQLPFRALSLSRRVLDEAMLQRAAERGCDVICGASVERLSANGDMWSAQLGDGATLQARTVFLACGKHELHGWTRGDGVQGDMVGFKLHWRLSAEQTQQLREWMELFLFPGGYGGLSLVEEEIANLCLVVRRRVLRRWGGWRPLLAAVVSENQRLRHLLDGARDLWGKPLAISSIPYGYLAQRPCGLWRVGDQAAVIPSFTGDGMSIALHSANFAAHMYMDGRSADEYSRALRLQLSRSVSLATWISRAMVTGTGRNLAVLGVRLFPATMQAGVRWIASSTRVPANALLPGEAH
jgi:flavin-dependent dehydrogenase